MACAVSKFLITCSSLLAMTLHTVMHMIHSFRYHFHYNDAFIWIFLIHKSQMDLVPPWLAHAHAHISFAIAMLGYLITGFRLGLFAVARWRWFTPCGRVTCPAHFDDFPHFAKYHWLPFRLPSMPFVSRLTHFSIRLSPIIIMQRYGCRVTGAIFLLLCFAR